MSALNSQSDCPIAVAVFSRLLRQIAIAFVALGALKLQLISARFAVHIFEVEAYEKALFFIKYQQW